MLTREYLVHSWTSYLDVFPIGLSLISRPKKCNTMHKRNLPFRTVKAGGEKKTWRGWLHRFMLPTNIGTKTWTVSVWISVTHSPGPANICWVHCVLYSKQPMKSFLPVLVPPHVTIYCPLELNPPPPAAGDLLWVSETYERDGGRCVAQLSTKSKSPDMQQQLRTECSTRLWSSSWTTLLSGHPLHSSLWHEYIVDMPVWICWTRSCVMEQLETSKRNLKLSQMFNYKKKKDFWFCVLFTKNKKILCLNLKVNVPFKETPGK